MVLERGIIIVLGNFLGFVHRDVPPYVRPFPPYWFNFRCSWFAGGYHIVNSEQQRVGSIGTLHTRQFGSWGTDHKKEYLQGESSEWDEACDIGEFNGRYIPNKVQEAGGGNNDIFNPELSKFRYLKLYSGLENGVKIFGYQITW